MCKLCDNLLEKSKQFILNVRNTLADDNLCEIIREDDCTDCNGCIINEFQLRFYESNGTIFVSVEYTHKMNTKNNQDLIIQPFSEGLPLNFCPNCGEQISEKMRDIDSINYYFSIEDKSEITATKINENGLLVFKKASGPKNFKRY